MGRWGGGGWGGGGGGGGAKGPSLLAKHTKLRSWMASSSALYIQQCAVFLPLPFKKSVHATRPVCSKANLVGWF